MDAPLFLPEIRSTASGKIKKGRDYLFGGGKEHSFRPRENAKYAKHGSGCVLASAITANLAKGYNLQRSCLMAKQYTLRFLNSNSTLLGYHKI
jgi:hydroxymethylpyrimidine/phosphomethylpyrimidine kinase